MNRSLAQLRHFRRWLTTGAAWHWYSLTTVTLSGLLIAVLLLLVTTQGLGHFWPKAMDEWIINTAETGNGQRLFARQLDKRIQAGVSKLEAGSAPESESSDSEQLLLQFQAFDKDQASWQYQWINADRVVRTSRPTSLLEINLKTGGRVYGYPLILAFNEQQQVDGQALANLLRKGDWNVSDTSPDKSVGIDDTTSQPHLFLRLQDGSDYSVELSDVRNALFPNDATLSYRFRQFFRNIWTFLSTGPQPDYQGGILPAIYGTVLLVLLMSIMLVPLGVITAVYLHEYAKNNWLTKTLRIAVSNLAGIPGIVYGVFVLGVFVYGMGAQLDRWFFNSQLPLPTFGTGGLLWASIALALLTLPVVIVATEEGLARVPNDLRRGALALGATRSEMIWGTAVNAASPAILTGLILAMARAAGEVAPLLLVGAVKYTGQPLIESDFPYLHAERQFMHLGYQVYDFALQSANAHASIPLAYATTLILLALVVLLNLIAIRLRARLRRRFLVDYG